MSSLDETSVPSLDETSVSSLDETSVPCVFSIETSTSFLDDTSVPPLDETSVSSVIDCLTARQTCCWPQCRASAARRTSAVRGGVRDEQGEEPFDDYAGTRKEGWRFCRRMETGVEVWVQDSVTTPAACLQLVSA